MTPERHLVVFARKPERGRVKTRLAAHIGERQALEFYRRTLTEVMGRMAAGWWRCWISLTPDRAVSEPPFWPKAFNAIEQGGGDLGRRMARTFDALPPGPAVIVGADIPAIRGHHIEAAFRALNDHHTVFGPAADGGYWLVGVNRTFAVTALFNDVRWSSEQALADTLANVAGMGKTSAQLGTLEDIDDAAAYRRWLIGVP